MVESQHIAATMKLVDDRAEQDLLESLLETSKPPVADTTMSENDSSDSGFVSPITGTDTCLAVSPGAKTTEPFWLR